MGTKTIRNALGAFFRRLHKEQQKQASGGSVRNGDFDNFRVDLLRQSVLDKIAELIRERVIERTLDGKDYKGHIFVEYTERYAKQKGVSVSDVNLKLSGEMLSDFWVKVFTVEPFFMINEVYFIDLGYLTIHYGFHSDDATEKYYYNANEQGDKSKTRDFLGAVADKPLLPMKELLEIIQIAIREA